MKILIKSSWVIFSIFALTACGKSSDSTPIGEGGTGLEINLTSFSVKAEGTAENTALALLETENTQRGFELRWKISGTPAYWFSFHLSDDQYLSEDTDTEFYSHACVDSMDSCANVDMVLACRFTAADEVACGTLGSSSIQPFAANLPRKAYIIMQASIPGAPEYKTAAFPVQLH